MERKNQVADQRWYVAASWLPDGFLDAAIRSGHAVYRSEGVFWVFRDYHDALRFAGNPWCVTATPRKTVAWRHRLWWQKRRVQFGVGVVIGLFAPAILPSSWRTENAIVFFVAIGAVTGIISYLIGRQVES